MLYSSRILRYPIGISFISVHRTPYSDVFHGTDISDKHVTQSSDKPTALIFESALVRGEIPLSFCRHLLMNM